MKIDQGSKADDSHGNGLEKEKSKSGVMVPPYHH